MVLKEKKNTMLLWLLVEKLMAFVLRKEKESIDQK